MHTAPFPFYFPSPRSINHMLQPFHCFIRLLALYIERKAQKFLTRQDIEYKGLLVVLSLSVPSYQYYSGQEIYPYQAVLKTFMTQSIFSGVLLVYMLSIFCPYQFLLCKAYCFLPRGKAQRHLLADITATQ